jgi:Holliday junction resolvasome RuvABC endonuclease subunit
MTERRGARDLAAAMERLTGLLAGAAELDWPSVIHAACDEIDDLRHTRTRHGNPPCRRRRGATQGGRPVTATVVGFDVSLARTGWAVLDWDTGCLIRCGVIETPADRPLVDRLEQIDISTRGVLLGLRNVADVGVESGFAHGSGETTRKLAAAWGVVSLACWAVAAIDPCQVPPAKAKHLATGNGAAKKPAVMAAACQRWGSPAADADIADACWVAEFVRQSRRSEG